MWSKIFYNSKCEREQQPRGEKLEQTSSFRQRRRNKEANWRKKVKGVEVLDNGRGRVLGDDTTMEELPPCRLLFSGFVNWRGGILPY
ncbi:hypothetical protein CEXT_516251 [Caerostris extrusa]|uniref:Uncharacterized protein n=1 Tax=Caerostris extrusa TaxID=172846 RepID=A0AAV4N9A9_CAEEX|nr:hypothetical protein CEXT_516251 [Caerostris extrusa]